MNRKLPVWALIVLDITLCGAALCIFALFHHVLPQSQEPIAVTAPQAPDAAQMPTFEFDFGEE
ncbi:MAG: hypothetical protein Q4C12_07205 [Clostridia bacterium]|nr:hypothetical protein [Clostridia bacterium]